MNIKELLVSYKLIDDRIELALEEIARLRSLAERMTQCISFDGRGGKGGHSDRVGNYAVRIAELEINTDREIDRLVDLREKILKIVSSLDDDVERIVIERRYIMFENNEAIAEKLGYSLRHIVRVHKSALAKLEKMYNSEEQIAS
ncbi:MAG: hypothetical protein J6O50_16465 [Ruminiclostridium sp.]|nr:hypothetical protein [Ruminiclostridium sp.]